MDSNTPALKAALSNKLYNFSSGSYTATRLEISFECDHPYGMDKITYVCQGAPTDDAAELVKFVEAAETCEAAAAGAYSKEDPKYIFGGKIIVCVVRWLCLNGELSTGCDHAHSFEKFQYVWKGATTNDAAELLKFVEAAETCEAAAAGAYLGDVHKNIVSRRLLSVQFERTKTHDNVSSAMFERRDIHRIRFTRTLLNTVKYVCQGAPTDDAAELLNLVEAPEIWRQKSTLSTIRTHQICTELRSSVCVALYKRWGFAVWT